MTVPLKMPTSSSCVNFMADLLQALFMLLLYTGTRLYRRNGNLSMFRAVVVTPFALHVVVGFEHDTELVMENIVLELHASFQSTV